MSLINCSECGKEVSDKAKACPNCGYPVSKIKENDFPTYTIIAVLLMIIWGFSMIFLHVGWIINSLLMIATFIVSIISLRSKEKLCILSALPLIVSGIVICMLLLEILIS